MRPNIADFPDSKQFLAAMLEWHIEKTGCTLRSLERQYPECSRRLVSSVLNGQRQINLKNLRAVAKWCQLSAVEITALERRLKSASSVLQRSKKKSGAVQHKKEEVILHEPQNHLFSDWLHPYVKDTCQLKGFEPTADRIRFMLGGIASKDRIQKSIDFLLSEGFWRRTMDGKVVLNEVLTVTSHHVPNNKLRAFHKQTLKIAQERIDTLPQDRRNESCMLLHLNNEDVPKLKALLDEFYTRLLEFAEEHPSGRDVLCQVVLNLTAAGDAT